MLFFKNNKKKIRKQYNEILNKEDLQKYFFKIKNTSYRNYQEVICRLERKLLNIDFINQCYKPCQDKIEVYYNEFLFRFKIKNDNLIFLNMKDLNYDSLMKEEFYNIYNKIQNVPNDNYCYDKNMMKQIKKYYSNSEDKLIEIVQKYANKEFFEKNIFNMTHHRLINTGQGYYIGITMRIYPNINLEYFYNEEDQSITLYLFADLNYLNEINVSLLDYY